MVECFAFGPVVGKDGAKTRKGRIRNVGSNPTGSTIGHVWVQVGKGGGFIRLFSCTPREIVWYTVVTQGEKNTMKNKPRFFVICRHTGVTLFSSSRGKRAFSFATRGVYGVHIFDPDREKMRRRTSADVRVERGGVTITPNLKPKDLKRRQ